MKFKTHLVLFAFVMVLFACSRQEEIPVPNTDKDKLAQEIRESEEFQALQAYKRSHKKM